MIKFQNLPNKSTPLNAANLNTNFDELKKDTNDLKNKVTNLNTKFDKVFESGSNSNGHYIKFSDGTMICTSKISRSVNNTNSWNGFYIGNVSNIPFAQSFLELYSCNVDIYSLGNLWKMSGSMPTLSGTNSFFTIGPESLTKDVTFCVTAIGRWK